MSADVVKNPLRYSDEKWSGEKMILTPYFIHPDFTNPTIISLFAKPDLRRGFGIAALTPSKKKAISWQQSGAVFPTSSEIQSAIKKVKDGDYSKTLVLANRYDGVDLPDDSCRVLILDSKPISTNLADRLQETFREDSKIVDLKTAQKIEQGMGRAVRGEKDYCIIIITGPSLINLLIGNRLAKYFSDQTNKQLQISKDIIQLISEQATTDDPYELLRQILAVSIKRDENWKNYYTQEMNSLKERVPDELLFSQLQFEKKAEDLCFSGQYSEAAIEIQKLLDSSIGRENKTERAYYMQEIARYYYHLQKSKSNDYQIEAYKLNRFLLKPRHGITFQRLELNRKRTENIQQWLKQFKTYSELELKIAEMLTNLSFGIKADYFERALNDLGISLGFACERPDKELKRGPDNLWNIDENEYILFECKNEVNDDRAEIVKEETGQMNNSCAWFKTNYNIDATKCIMIIPTKTVAASTGFNYNVEILRKRGLNRLKQNYQKFILEFSTYDVKNITEMQIESYLQIHQLQKDDILSIYAESIFQKKQ